MPKCCCKKTVNGELIVLKVNNYTHFKKQKDDVKAELHQTPLCLMKVKCSRCEYEKLDLVEANVVNCLWAELERAILFYLDIYTDTNVQTVLLPFKYNILKPQLRGMATVASGILI